jgi:hypothetical protein
MRSSPATPIGSRRRRLSRDRFLLATGHGAALAREAAAVDAEFIVALDVVAAAREGVSESRIRAASEVDRGWIQPTRTGVEHRFDPRSGRVRAARVERYDAITLSETPVQADPVEASTLLAEVWLAQPHDAATTQLLRRLKFAGVEIDLPEIAGAAAASARSITEVDLEAHLPFAIKRALSDCARVHRLPSGRRTALDYGEDGSSRRQWLRSCSVSRSDSGPANVPVTFPCTQRASSTT